MSAWWLIDLIAAQGGTGPAGPIGPQGQQGVQGATGPAGSQGVPGAAGSTGGTGAQGPQGNAGASGTTGSTGAQGPQGDVGAAGATGAPGSAGATGATGPAGSAGATGSAGSTGATGAAGAGFGTITESTPTRSIGGAAFKPSAVAPAFVVYSVRIVSSLTVGGGQSGRVELLSDTANPPTTVRCRVAGGATGTGVVGLTDTVTVENTLAYIVPTNHFVLIRSVDEVGTPTYSLPAQTEAALA